MADTVLITGASSGLGLEFARIFASRGCDLILTARSEEKLREIASELSIDRSIHIDVICADLSTDDGAQQLYEDVRALGRNIDQFVNNAGAGKAADTVDIDPAVLKALLHLDVSARTWCGRGTGRS